MIYGLYEMTKLQDDKIKIKIGIQYHILEKVEVTENDRQR